MTVLRWLRTTPWTLQVHTASPDSGCGPDGQVVSLRPSRTAAALVVCSTGPPASPICGATTNHSPFLLCGAPPQATEVQTRRLSGPTVGQTNSGCAPHGIALGCVSRPRPPTTARPCTRRFAGQLLPCRLVRNGTPNDPRETAKAPDRRPSARAGWSQGPRMGQRIALPKGESTTLTQGHA